MIEIIQAKPNDPQKWFHEVAKIHIEELKQGALIHLGIDGLSLLYQEIILIPRAGLWLAIENNKVLGFVSGCADTRSTYYRLFLRSGIKLAFFFLGNALRSHSLGKFIKIILYPFRGGNWEIPPQINRPAHAELLTIAVSKDAHRRGIGRMLVVNLEIGFRKWGVDDFYHVATVASDPLSNSFYTGMGFQPYGRKSFTDFSLQIYQKALVS